MKHASSVAINCPANAVISALFLVHQVSTHSALLLAAIADAVGQMIPQTGMPGTCEVFRMDDKMLLYFSNHW